MSTRILTGIKPTGTPHLGNYFGTFQPALARAQDYDEAFWFIANYHALNQIQNSEELTQNTLSIAATWIACGFTPNTVSHLYAQSDIPEIFELTQVLNSFTPKGWMNKAHAYKAAADQNAANQKPVDDGISMGLYTYPVLMAADILAFDANTVPVGKDQVQHVEIARDIAQKINAQYSQQLFVLPEHRVEADVGTIPGIDGRKMSKSYNNVIPLFASADERQKAINLIVTDSTKPAEPKQVEGTALFNLYKLVANAKQTDDFERRMANGGVGWGDAKNELGELMESYFGSMSAEYFRLMDNPDEVRATLRDGAEKVRPIAQETLARVRATVGIL